MTSQDLFDFQLFVRDEVRAKIFLPIRFLLIARGGGGRGGGGGGAGNAGGWEVNDKM